MENGQKLDTFRSLKVLYEVLAKDGPHDTVHYTMLLSESELIQLQEELPGFISATRVYPTT